MQVFNLSKPTVCAASAALLLTLAAQASAGALPALASRPVTSSWHLVWQDEFNGNNGAAADPSKWTYETGGAWGNGTELQYYTDRTANASIQNGNLQITVNKEDYQGNQYTSARLESHGKFAQMYGRFEARIKIPQGQGIWPAFWLLGDNIDQVGWPNSGEIDVMEHVNAERSIESTIHFPGASGDSSIGASYSLPRNGVFAAGYHVYAVEWEKGAVRFYVDDNLFQTVKRSDLKAGQQWVFDHPFHIIFNVAVGGPWAGNPDSSTEFPQSMLVDYVRVYSH